ncbi:permeases of the major facilitator superfamily [Stylonychia lemnae]|uniref:Permeases of the major facilitator superfamily n=1 Tax=Stylonychia lemnae TaxID=5949 RepID=A0A078B4J8_STYLE|nr:permeases of the major facilitator superfamily [Stylonychia lemnae]|eukprot:CDW88418.1 permeases of the major facilitator superfamily [Stylonychia lemnae]
MVKLNSTLFCLIFINGVKEGFFLILAPFLPEQLQEKGVSISSLIGGKIQGKIGRKLMRLDFQQESYKVLEEGFFKQQVQNSGLNSNIAYSELLIQFPQYEKQLVSWIEFGAVGGGFVGLVFSSFLSYFLGYIGPFALCEGSLLRMEKKSLLEMNQATQNQQKMYNSGLLDKQYTSQIEIEKSHILKHSILSGSQLKILSNNNSKIIKQQEQVYDKLGYSNILFTMKGFYGCVAVALNLHTFYYHDTIIANYLMTTYDFQPWAVSLVQSCQPVGFLLTTHFASKIIPKFNPQIILILAQIFQAGAAFLVGPSLFFELPEKIYIMIIGLLLTGMASPFSLITPYSVLEQSLLSQRDKNFNPEEVQDIVSGIFNSCYAIGGITGPIYGGYVNDLTNFRTTSDIMAVILLFIGVTQLLLVYIPDRQRLKNKEKSNKKQLKGNIESKNVIETIDTGNIIEETI